MTAAMLLPLLLSVGARGALVTRIVPMPQFQAIRALPESVDAILESDPCAIADKTIYALEGSIVETQAQMWAYLMRQPHFSMRRLSHKPGEEITYPEIKSLFYQRLAFWDRMESISKPAPEALKRLNDISMNIRLVKIMRGQHGVLNCSFKRS